MRSCSLRKDTAVEIVSLLSSQNLIYTSLCTFEVILLQNDCVVLSCPTTKCMILVVTCELIPPKTKRKPQWQDPLYNLILRGGVKKGNEENKYFSLQFTF